MKRYLIALVIVLGLANRTHAAIIIPTPSVTVTAPIGGEVLHEGQTFQIVWQYAPGDINGDGQVDISDYGLMDFLRPIGLYDPTHQVEVNLGKIVGNTTTLTPIGQSAGNQANDGGVLNLTVPNGENNATYFIEIDGIPSVDQTSYTATSSPFTIAVTPQVFNQSGVSGTSHGSSCLAFWEGTTTHTPCWYDIQQAVWALMNYGK